MKNLILIVITMSLAITPQAYGVKASQLSANLTSTEEILNSEVLLSEKIQKNLEDPERIKKLEALGVSKEEAQKRMAGLSESEVRQLLKGQHLQAGGDKVTIGVTTLLLIIIIALLI